MLKYIRSKIIIKLIIGLVLIVFVSSGFTLYTLKKVNTLKTEKNLEDDINFNFNLVKNGYNILLYNFDDKTIQKMNNLLLLNENIIAINIFNGQDLFVATMRENGSIKNITKPYTLTVNNQYISKISGDMSYKDLNLGKIEIFYTKELAVKEIQAQVRSLLMTFIFMSLAIILFVYLMMKFSIIKQVQQLSRISTYIARDNAYSLRVENHSTDEIGNLFNGFNNMLDKIEARDTELKKTKSYLSNIIESMPSMLITIDENNVITQWNQAAVLVTGVPAVNVIGKNIFEVTGLFDNFLTASKEFITKRVPHYLYRQHLNGDDDNLKNISFYPLITNGVKGLVVRVDDVTELEKKDEQLRQMQKMETVGTLAGGLEHDFNNVLGGIVGIVSIMKYEILSNDGITPEKLNDYINIIEESGQRATDMVQQLLALSRKYELVLINTDLNSSTKHVIRLCKNSFEKSVEIDYRPYPERAIYLADPTQIEQVILNLCLNAYHAMTLMKKEDDHQGGLLTIRIEKILADKYFCNHHPEAEEIEYWRLMIGDTGVGMDSKTIAKMFEPFFTTKEKGKGTGLGLAMVYNIIKQHNGFIDVYSEINIGTTISVYLPVLKEFNENEVNQVRDKVIKGEGTILVIDDEAMMRNIAKTMLEDCNYKIYYAEDGVSGLEKYLQHKDEIDMVLLDMVMPKLSGEEVYDELKKINPDIKVLLTSGFLQDDRVQKVLSKGVNGFIQKPYTIEKLSKAVDRILNEKNSI